MRTIPLCTVLLGVVVGLSATTACHRTETGVTAQAAASIDMKTKETTIAVQGMSCVSCVARVTKALSSTAGVAEAKVYLEKNEARVRFDPAKVTPERLATVVNNLGYQATLSPAAGK